MVACSGGVQIGCSVVSTKTPTMARSLSFTTCNLSSCRTPATLSRSSSTRTRLCVSDKRTAQRGRERGRNDAVDENGQSSPAHVRVRQRLCFILLDA